MTWFFTERLAKLGKRLPRDMDDQFICVQRELDDVMETHQRFLNIQKQPLAQGVLVLQIALGLRDYLQESSLMPTTFFYPFLAMLF